MLNECLQAGEDGLWAVWLVSWELKQARACIGLGVGERAMYCGVASRIDGEKTQLKCHCLGYEVNIELI